MFAGAVAFQSPHGGGKPGAPVPAAPADDLAADLAELEFRLHLWTRSGERIEQLLAATRNGSMGYAVLYAAAKEYTERYLTLSRKGTVIYSWNKPKEP
jgi:hypothetical protein